MCDDEGGPSYATSNEIQIPQCSNCRLSHVLRDACVSIFSVSNACIGASVSPGIGRVIRNLVTASW
jgi:hypothetical protein